MCNATNSAGSATATTYLDVKGISISLSLSRAFIMPRNALQVQVIQVGIMKRSSFVVQFLIF